LKKKLAAPRKKVAASTLPLEVTEPAAAEDTPEPRSVSIPADEPPIEPTVSLAPDATEPAEAALHAESIDDLPERPELVEPSEPLAPFEPPAHLASFERPEPPEPLELLEPPEPLEPREPSVPVYTSTVMDQTRSAVWPLMAALVIGLAIGFAGGYGIGTTREHQTPVATEAQVLPVQGTPVGRDATEIAVSKPSDSPAKPLAAPPSNVPSATASVKPRPTPPPIRSAPPAPDRRSAASRTAPERPATRPRPPAPVPAGTSGEFVGRLSVDSRPVGARVFLDNKPIGVTPLAVPTVRAGEHAIRLERDGYRHWTSTVRIVSGEQNKVTASLDR
jgi:hypothetical protein